MFYSRWDLHFGTIIFYSLIRAVEVPAGSAFQDCPVANLKLMTVSSTHCRYIELAILITLNVALILVHCMRACVAKGAPTATDICLVQEIRLSSSTILGASHPSHVKRGANLTALHACMRGQGCNDRDRHMFGTSAPHLRRQLPCADRWCSRWARGHLRAEDIAWEDAT